MIKFIKKVIKLIFTAFVLLLSITATMALFFSPWVPTRKKDLNRIIKLAKLKKGQLVYELGCGDSRFSVAVAKKSNAKVIGVELSLFYYLLSITKITAMNLNEKIKVRWRNFFKINLSDADLVFFYLTPRLAQKLTYKLKKELKRGAKVISYAYKIPGWLPSRIDGLETGDTPIYVYEIDKGLEGFV